MAAVTTMIQEELEQSESIVCQKNIKSKQDFKEIFCSAKPIKEF